MLSINQELNKKALASPLPYFLEEGCCIFPAFFFQERYTCPKLCLEMVGTPGSCQGEGNGWSHLKKKVHRNINFRSDRGRFFPGIGSCKHLTARCERLLGSWMRPKKFSAFYSATGRQSTGQQGSSTDSQHLFKGFQTILQHPDTVPTPPLAKNSLV